MARVPSDESDQVVIDWRMVSVGAAILSAFCVGVTVVLTLLALHPRPEPEPVSVAAAEEPPPVRVIIDDLLLPEPVEVVEPPLEWFPPPPPPPELPKGVVGLRPPVPLPTAELMGPEVARPTDYALTLPPRIRHMEDKGEEWLRAWLRDNVPELTSKIVEDATAKVLAQVAKEKNKRVERLRGRVERLRGAELEAREKEEDARTVAHPLLEAMAKAPELNGVVFRGASECKIPRSTAKQRTAYALEVRQVEASRAKVKRDSCDTVYPPERSRFYSLASGAYAVSPPENYGYYELTAENYRRLAKPEATSTLVQMLQPESHFDRFALVSTLQAIKGSEASVALAQRAVFDLSPLVREAAVRALKDRSPSEYRSVLLVGLRHPWRHAANHAAEAIAALNDRGIVTELIALLDQPDPCQPFKNKDDKWVVKELVRVNHFRNCLMCHAESQSQYDPLRGRIPVPGEPIRTGERYYGGTGGFVRADVVYLKQDFSVIQPVPRSETERRLDAWPERQRFDYVVREKLLSDADLAALKKKDGGGSYPQREAVLFALRELTGIDAGASSSDWQITLQEYGLLPEKP
jgi:hypothetical protein